MRYSIPLLLVVLAGLAVPARAGSLSGTFGGEILFAIDKPSGVLLQTFIGGGDDTTYGAYTATSQSTVDTSHPPQFLLSGGTFRMSFALGTVEGTYTGTGTDNGVGTNTFTLDVVITGGTGTFTGMMGTFILTGDFTHVSSSPMVIRGSYDGSLAIPEPSSLALLAPAVISGAFVLLHQRRCKATALLR